MPGAKKKLFRSRPERSCSVRQNDALHSRGPGECRRYSTDAKEGSRGKLERPRGLEPPPTAWQAVVLPLYYGRSQRTKRLYHARQTTARHTPTFCLFSYGSVPFRESIDLAYASGSDHRRLLLSLGESHGLGSVNIDAGKLLTVLVVNGHLPVPVLAPFIFAQNTFASCRLSFSLLGFRFHPFSHWGRVNIAALELFYKYVSSKE